MIGRGRRSARTPRWQEERDRLHNELPAWLTWPQRQWWIYALGAVFLLAQVAADALDGADAANVTFGLAVATFLAALAWFGYRHRQD